MITKNYIRIFILYILLTTASLSVANWRDYIPNFGIQSHLFSLASSANKYVIAGALFATGTGYLLYRHKTRKNPIIIEIKEDEKLNIEIKEDKKINQENLEKLIDNLKKSKDSENDLQKCSQYIDAKIAELRLNQSNFNSSYFLQQYIQCDIDKFETIKARIRE